MKLNHNRLALGLVFLFAWSSCGQPVTAQTFTIPWFKIAGGGGFSSGGSFELEGTIGQHDAGETMTGGSFTLSGGFWTQSSGGGGIHQVVATTLNVTRGTHASGEVPELAVSDNNDVSIQRANSDIQARTEFEVKANSPVASPSSFEVTLEGAVFSRSPVNQTIELFDYNASSWVAIDTRPAARFADSTVTVGASGNLSRFVEPVTNCIEARIRFLATNPRQVLIQHGLFCVDD